MFHRHFAGLLLASLVAVGTAACGESDDLGASSGGANDDGGGGDGGGGGPAVDGAPVPGQPYRNAVMADGPVGYWRLGESSGTTAKDEIGNAHPGTYYGGYEQKVPGITAEDTATRFDGTTGCISVGQFFRFPGRVPYSAEGWVKITSYGAEGTRIVSTEGFPTGIRSGWNLSASYGATGYPYFDAWNSEGDTKNQYVMGAYSSTSPDQGKLPLDVWSHVVGTFNDEAEEVWVNGVLRNHVKQSSLPRPDQGTFTIGCAGSGSGQIYLGAHGALDEIAVYDKVLTKERILAHYELGRPR